MEIASVIVSFSGYGPAISIKDVDGLELLPAENRSKFKLSGEK